MNYTGLCSDWQPKSIFWPIQMLSRLILGSLDSNICFVFFCKSDANGLKCHSSQIYADVSQPACSGHSSDFKVSSVSLAAGNTTATSSWSASEWLSGIHAASSRAVWNNSLRSHAETSPLRLDSEIVWRARWLISISHASVWKSCVNGVCDESQPRYCRSNPADMLALSGHVKRIWSLTNNRR